jgi:hypothetical protein
VVLPSSKKIRSIFIEILTPSKNLCFWKNIKIYYLTQVYC